VTILWRIAREKLLPEGQTDTGHHFYEDQDYFRHQVLKKNKIWVVELDRHPVAFMAMENEFIDQLYVHPDHQRRKALAKRSWPLPGIDPLNTSGCLPCRPTRMRGHSMKNMDL
jgi:hypothetical protein